MAAFQKTTDGMNAADSQNGYQEQHPRIQKPAELLIRCTVSYYGSQRACSSCSAFFGPTTKKVYIPAIGDVFDQASNLYSKSQQSDHQTKHLTVLWFFDISHSQRFIDMKGIMKSAYPFKALLLASLLALACKAHA